jgi:hypothetical protein
MLVRLTGLTISVLLSGRSGRTKLLVLALLLGLLSLFVVGPKDNRLMPDVDSRATCFADGVVSSVMEDVLAVLPPCRFLLLIVTLGGM